VEGGNVVYEERMLEILPSYVTRRESWTSAAASSSTGVPRRRQEHGMYRDEPDLAGRIMIVGGPWRGRGGGFDVVRR
jgi:hypothetical protein